MSDIIYFYGVKNEYYCFSNFYPCEFSDGCLQYNCSEQYFMKKKQELFDPENKSLANEIMNAKNPTKIKKCGRSVNNYNEQVWENQRIKHMINGLFLKFSQNENLKKILLDTNKKILAEASPYDKIWGIGISVDDAYAGKKWNGRNLLGESLMHVRNKLEKDNIEEL